VRKFADTVCVMKDGKIVERGPVERAFTARASLSRAAGRGAEARSRSDPADAPMIFGPRTCGSGFRSGALPARTVGIKAVDGVTIAVRKGETLGVVGESAGKTTLGLAILRLILAGDNRVPGQFDRGIELQDHAPVPSRHADRVPVYGSLSPRMSVSDIIEEGLWHHQARGGARGARRGAARRRPRSRLRFRYPHEFSGGQRQRIASPARSCWSRPSSCLMSRPARSTC
jgi:microcin C transport system ATP-binding protein